MLYFYFNTIKQRKAKIKQNLLLKAACDVTGCLHTSSSVATVQSKLQPLYGSVATEHSAEMGQTWFLIIRGKERVILGHFVLCSYL